MVSRINKLNHSGSKNLIEHSSSLKLRNDGCCEGYTLYSVPSPDALPHQRATLVDMNGEIVHEWSITGFPAKMFPGGSLLGSKRMREVKEPHSGGMGYQDTIEFVQEGWDGKEEWSFANWDDDGTGLMMSRQHHDYQREGNPVGYYAPGQEFVDRGKILILAHKNKVVPKISDKILQDDVIYEVEWNQNFTGFEWYASDHFDEIGFDKTAKEAIYKNPRYNKNLGYGDWVHLNSISLLGRNCWHDETGDERFNPENIIVTSRNANFIAIIHRKTGNIVWMVGPDFSEDTPEHNLGQLVGPHHPHMIPEHLPGEGNILVFDNGGTSGYGGSPGFPRYTRDYSRVIEFNPVTLETIWKYGTEQGKEKFYSHFISSAQRLPNGNTLITEGANGRIFEVTSKKEIVWEYISPSTGKKGKAVYRAYRIPPEWVPGNPANYDEWATLFIL
ncbi:aryl-sulfate sulfotransferase [Candidatus Bathyarchaeota archaeon]|nr:aryl-sulfate sulfotransferase [Candidatus Bathyarchaeota archaeon]